MKQVALILAVLAFGGYLVVTEAKYLDGEISGDPIPLRSKIIRIARAHNSERKKDDEENMDTPTLDNDSDKVYSCSME